MGKEGKGHRGVVGRPLLLRRAVCALCSLFFFVSQARPTRLAGWPAAAIMDHFEGVVCFFVMFVCDDAVGGLRVHAAATPERLSRNNLVCFRVMPPSVLTRRRVLWSCVAASERRRCLSWAVSAPGLPRNGSRKRTWSSGGSAGSWPGPCSSRCVSKVDIQRSSCSTAYRRCAGCSFPQSCVQAILVEVSVSGEGPTTERNRRTRVPCESDGRRQL